MVFDTVQANMLQNLEGSARDLIDLLEETVIEWRVAQTAKLNKPQMTPAGRMP